MPLDTTVKIFHSGMSGAPVLSGTAGSMIGVLDACLVNGWGTATVDSVVIASGIATVTRGAGHPFEEDMVCEIAGASVTGGSLNGERKVLSVVSATQYTIDAEGIPNQTATGTITHKVAAAGWAKAFSGTNLAAYRANDVTGNRFYCRVDDTGTQTARARGYETMTAISTGTGLFPTDALLNGGEFWPKSNAADATSRRWVIIASGKTFYIFSHWVNSATAVNFGAVGAFGDLVRAGSSDNYASFIYGYESAAHTGTPGTISAASELVCAGISASAGTCMPRSTFGIGSAITAVRSYPTFTGPNSAAAIYSGGLGQGTNHATFPNGADNGLYLGQVVLMNPTPVTYRGKMPGMYGVPQVVGNTVFAHLNRLQNVPDYPGKTFRAINNGNGVQFVDVSGPWN